MPRPFLRAMPVSLHFRLGCRPTGSQDGADGFLAPEVVLRDALAAHRPHAVLRPAFHDDLRIRRRRPDPATLAGLAFARVDARARL